MLGHTFSLMFAVSKDISPIPLLMKNSNGFIDVRMGFRYQGYNLIDLGCCPFTIIFGLNCEKEITPIFMSQGTIVLLIILQLILNG